MYSVHFAGSKTKTSVIQPHLCAGLAKHSMHSINGRTRVQPRTQPSPFDSSTCLNHYNSLGLCIADTAASFRQRPSCFSNRGLFSASHHLFSSSFHSLLIQPKENLETKQTLFVPRARGRRWPCRPFCRCHGALASWVATGCPSACQHVGKAICSHFPCSQKNPQEHEFKLVTIYKNGNCYCSADQRVCFKSKKKNKLNPISGFSHSCFYSEWILLSQKVFRSPITDACGSVTALPTPAPRSQCWGNCTASTYLLFLSMTTQCWGGTLKGRLTCLGEGPPLLALSLTNQEWDSQPRTTSFHLFLKKRLHVNQLKEGSMVTR